MGVVNIYFFPCLLECLILLFNHVTILGSGECEHT